MREWLRPDRSDDVLKAFRLLGADYSTEVLFSRQTHFNGEHDDEVIYRAGPFTQSAPNDAQH